MKYGYIRVSSAEQNTARQEVIMQDLGVDKVYIEKISGKDKNRPQLIKLMDKVQAGDCIIVESISRFARNTKDLLDLISELKEKEVEFISKKEAIDTSTPTGQFMLTIFGAVAQLERDYIKQRTAEGIAIAKKEGKYKGRQFEIDIEKFKMLDDLYQNKQISKAEFIKEMGYKSASSIFATRKRLAELEGKA